MHTLSTRNFILLLAFCCLILHSFNVDAALEAEFITGVTLGQQLLAAVTTGDIKLVHKSLQEGADINYKNEYGDSAIYLASNNDRIKILEMLLNVEGIEVNYTSALNMASANGYTEVVRMLLKVNGIQVSSTGKFFGTAFFLARFHGHYQVAKMLESHIGTLPLSPEEEIRMQW